MTTVYKQYSYSALTKSAGRILRPFVISVDHPWYAICGYNTGCDVEATTVFSVASGQCVFVGKYFNQYTVVVQYNSNVYFQYAHLDSVDVALNAAVAAGDVVGHCHDYVRFGYLSPVVDVDTAWLFRMRGEVLMFNDPEPFIYNGMYMISFRLPTEDYDHMILPIRSGSAMDVELTDGRGVVSNDVQF